MKLLVTGGSGLLGSAIATQLPNVYTVYSGFNQHIATAGIPIPLDVTNREAVKDSFRKIKPDAVIHSAAMTHVDRCEENQRQATLVNVEGTRNVADEAAKHGSYVVYISTDYVFSGEIGGYKETDKPNPINHYGVTKLEGEKIISAYPEHCIARPSVIYGSRPAAGKDNFVLWVIKQLRDRKPIQILTDQHVSPTLNTNLAEMIYEVMERHLKGVYHLSGATAISRYDFALKIAKTFELDQSLIIPATSDKMSWAAKRPMNSSLNLEKASKTLRCKPIEIDEALNRLKAEIEKAQVKL